MNVAAGLPPLERWTPETVLAIAPGEYDWIDFKAGGWLKESDWLQKLSAYVSAWANYDGGYLVIGVSNPKTGKALEFDHAIDQKTVSAVLERLDVLIPTMVDEPLPVGAFKTHPVTDQSGECLAIVIGISESINAPHQDTTRKIYWARRGRRLDPLRHREILDIQRRRKHPTIRTKLTLSYGGFRDAVFCWRVYNTSNVLARHVKAVIRLPSNLHGSGIAFPEERTVLGDDGTASYLELRIVNALGGPLFPHDDISRTFVAKLGATFVPSPGSPPLLPPIEKVSVTTFADNMPPFFEQFEKSAILKPR
jgi:hypothetical protein